MSRTSVPALSRKPRPLNLAAVKPEDQPAIRRMLEWEGPPPDRDVYYWAEDFALEVAQWVFERKGKHGFGFRRDELFRILGECIEIAEMIRTYERLFRQRLN